MLYGGIDPGKTGAIAVISGDMEIHLLEDWAGDEIQMANVLRKMMGISPNQFRFVLEKVSSMPREGVKSAFTFGTNYGTWKGILAAFQISFIEASPQTWQKGMLSKAADKKPALAAAGRLFPTAELYGPRGGGKDGRADALLIAEYSRRIFSNKIERSTR